MSQSDDLAVDDPLADGPVLLLLLRLSLRKLDKSCRNASQQHVDGAIS